MVSLKGFVFLAWISFGPGSVLCAVITTSYQRTIVFKEPFPDKALPGHVMRTEQVPDEAGCRVKCYLEPNCVSINVGPINEEQLTCELNNHTDESLSQSLLREKKHYTHYTVENFCHGDPCPGNVSVCQVGFTSKGYRCACREGYTATGDHGQCEDINECQPNSRSCKPGYECNNTIGSFVCKCPSGFVEENNNCKECQDALGMESGAISDGQVRASSALHGTHQGRLNFKHCGNVAGGWTATEIDGNQWLEVDLLRSNVTVTGVATQGGSEVDEWVTRYKIQYTNNGVVFHNFTEKGQSMEKEFEGNMDRDTVKHNELNPPVKARYVRFRPTAWNGKISMRVELYGCHACNKALGMENRAISDGQITSSSEWKSKVSASQGRLHNSGDGSNGWGAWIAGTTNQEQWLQVDLIQTVMVKGSATQGRGNRGGKNSWVTKYKLQYSNDGRTFETYTENGKSKDKEFAGNTDRDTVVYNDINPPIIGRYIRFRPTAWHKYITMRVELYGCNVSSCQSLRSRYPRPPSGVYWINPDVGSPANRFKAYCDMETDGGGWTLVWSYRFTNYEHFTEESNAITPRPDWPTKRQVDVLISTTPPLNETDYNAIKFSLWKQLGRQVLIKSNINNWLICNPGTGSLVDWKDGSVSCRIINRVTDRCNKTEAPCTITAKKARFGPWLSGSNTSEQIHYYFDGYTKEHWPAHDPCGETQPNHLQDVDNPHGSIFVR